MLTGDANAPELGRLRALLAEMGDLVAVYLFGSAARDGGELPGDLDLAVFFPPTDGDPLRRSLALQRRLELAGLPVDVHDFGGLPPAVQVRVLQEGVLLLDRDPAERIRREVRALFEYDDFAPYLQRIRQGVLDRVRQGRDHG